MGLVETADMLISPADLDSLAAEAAAAVDQRDDDVDSC
jgi:hypothetical protein